jgi:sugar lactone lactonase YvrE
VDNTEGQLHWLDFASGRRDAAHAGKTVGFVALTTDPEVVILGVGAGLSFFNLANRQFEWIFDLEPAVAKLRCNDGKVDPSGRLWAGTMQSGGETDEGSLFAIDSDLGPTAMLRGLRISNGLAWRQERAWMYFVDSPTCRIDRFDWNGSTGAIGRRITLAEFPASDGTPDGMTIDTEGHLWVAFWGGGCVRHIDGETGRVLGSIELPVAQVTSCTFGGDDHATLFITSAAHGLSPVERALQPLAGALFAATPGPVGMPAQVFPCAPKFGKPRARTDRNGTALSASQLRL